MKKVRTVWVRVTHRPRGSESSAWYYGWVFPSGSMAMGRDTLRRIGLGRMGVPRG